MYKGTREGTRVATKYSWKYTIYIIGLIILVIGMMWNREVRAATNVHAKWSGEYAHVVSWQYELENTKAYVFKRNPLYQGETSMGETTGTQFTFTGEDHRTKPQEGDEYRVDEYQQDSQGFWFPVRRGTWVKLENQRPVSRRSILPIVVR